VIASILSQLQPDPALASKKKRVLLVDSSRATRDLRSETMRRLGAEVDCAADISEARCWWKPDIYNLVLVNVPAPRVQIDKFCDDMRRMMPRQLIMFLVGKPDYITVLPKEVPADGESTSDNDHEPGPSLVVDEKASAGNGSSQRWGILEACHRISVVRSKLNARTRAMCDLPRPKRDSESLSPVARTKSTACFPSLLPDFA
jgi:hypothetical protein